MPDEPDDWSDPPAPLPAEDRLWRHPSEVAGVAPRPAPTPPPARRPRHRGRLLAVAVVSGLTGAGATIAALAVVGSLTPRTIERVEQARATPVSDTTPTTRTATAVAAGIAPAVVEVTASTGDWRRRGSGVVMREDGLILTSEALVAGAEALVVTWPSGTSATATDRGHDDMTGLAAITVEGSGHPVADLEGGEPVPGQTAITVAGPSGAGGPTIARSVVSAANAHADPDRGRLLGMIETDQPVPDWADGGALVDDDGHLLGVCISVPERATTGFAVPTEVAQRVAIDLGTFGHVDRGWLGVRGTMSDPTDDTPGGVLVDEVAPGSPAEGADLHPGDLLTAVDGRPVRSLADVQAALTLTRPDEDITVELARGDQTTTVEVTLAENPG